MSLLTRLETRVRRREIQGTVTLPDFSAGFLTSLVRSQDELPDESRGVGGYIHVSSLLDFCPRLARILAIEGRDNKSHPRSPDRVMWAIGRAVESHVRKQVIAAIGRENVYGIWKCHCGNLEVVGIGSRDICNCCKKEATEYYEKPVFDHDLKIVGNPDMVIVQGGKFRVIEIKSIKVDLHNALTEPVPNHVFQMNTYRRLLALEHGERKVHAESIAMYVAKDYAYSSPYKEFHRHKSEQEGIISAAFSQVADMRRKELDSILPDKLAVCSTPSSPKAKKCCCLVSCFNQ